MIDHHFEDTQMARQSLLTAETRQELFGLPEGPKQLMRFYTLSWDDHGLSRSWRRNENRLGLAIHVALLRHPGQGWLNGSVLPGHSSIDWLNSWPCRTYFRLHRCVDMSFLLF